MASTDLAANTITVVSDIDGRRCKLVIKSGLRTLTVANIKKHLVGPTGLAVGEQVITYDGRVLADKLTGGQVGLKGGDQLRLSALKRDASASGGGAPTPTPAPAPAPAAPAPPAEGTRRAPPLEAPVPMPPAAPAMPAYTPAMPPGGALQATRPSPAPPPAAAPARDSYTAPTFPASHPPPVGPVVAADARGGAHAEFAPVVVPAPPKSDWQLEVRNANLECENEGCSVKPWRKSPTPRPRHPPQRLLQELERVKEEAALAAAAARNREADLEARLAATEQLATARTAAADGLAARLQETEHQLRAAEDAAEAVAANTLRQKATTSLELARQNLRAFGRELGVGDDLDFDESSTCVIGVERRYTILLTYDAATERLYVYSTLLTYLPKDPVVRLRLYEMLMEGAFMGREMCGGGVGLSLKNEVVLMATSIDLKHSDGDALNSVAPAFVDCLVQWRQAVHDILRDTAAPGAGAAGAPAPAPAVGAPASDGLVSTINAQERLISEQQARIHHQRGCL